MSTIKNTTHDDLAAVIGFSATVRLAAWYGHGVSLYVPHTVEDNQVLVRLIGRPAAERLTQEFAGDLITVPRLSAYAEEEARCKIAILLSSGMSPRQASRLVSVGERRVQQICRELEVSGLIKPTAPARKKDKPADSGKDTHPYLVWNNPVGKSEAADSEEKAPS